MFYPIKKMNFILKKKIERILYFYFYRSFFRSKLMMKNDGKFKYAHDLHINKILRFKIIF